jgi:hypothetical protein
MKSLLLLLLTISPYTELGPSIVLTLPSPLVVVQSYLLLLIPAMLFV